MNHRNKVSIKSIFSTINSQNARELGESRSQTLRRLLSRNSQNCLKQSRMMIPFLKLLCALLFRAAHRDNFCISICMFLTVRQTHPDQLCKELDVCASFTQSCLLPKCFTILTCETSKTQDIYRVVFFNGSAQKFQVLKMAKPLPKK